uniref:AlNc14C236G9395 protein n=1 Tax=Albugo laibachii Nc14 TaxID=890382 RepID=F0W8C6_9STRA|nr:AlNc14C34G3057 [Albugo laibachii Nc14]CCA24377.1 AlNc14C236G9395 [Albugo laibachii Nc14]|eukprot:CCA24377.1 AlNc14C236G9395 [Albugo laibachii Nc14]
MVTQPKQLMLLLVFGVSLTSLLLASGVGSGSSTSEFYTQACIHANACSCIEKNPQNGQQEPRKVIQETDSFAQIEASVNCLMQMIQQQYMQYEGEFGKVACALEEDLVKQSEVEKKLLMIASIINSVHESSVEADQ